MRSKTCFALIVSCFGIALLLCLHNCRAIRRQSDARPVRHELWDALVKKHVRPDGMVDYRGFVQDSAELNRYLRLLASGHPNDAHWSRQEQMAYWINAYNAYTVQLVVRHYPVASIKDIQRGIPFVNTVWDIKFIQIEGHTYDLNNIEHNILRPVFRDARIHAAINCASFSCPRLRPEAYTADQLDAQLTDAMRTFVNDPLRNRVAPDGADISAIFKWFSGDFERDAGSVRSYINRYADAKLLDTGRLGYLDYDWNLNEALK